MATRVGVVTSGTTEQPDGRRPKYVTEIILEEGVLCVGDQIEIRRGSTTLGPITIEGIKYNGQEMRCISASRSAELYWCADISAQDEDEVWLL